MSQADIDCNEVIERLFEFLDGELDSRRHADIERHLARCRDCFTRAEFERRLKGRLAEAGSASAPDTLRRRIRGLLDRY